MAQNTCPLDIDEATILPLSLGFKDKVFDLNEFVEAGETRLAKWYNEQAWTGYTEGCNKTYIILYKKKLIGYFTLTLDRCELLPKVKYKTKLNPLVLVLCKLLIVPELRKCGVGRRALDFTLDAVRNIDAIIRCRGILVEATSNSTEFYRKFGFEGLSDETSELGTRKHFFPYSGE